MRLFAASIGTESNTFSPVPTSLEDYRDCLFVRPGEPLEEAPGMCSALPWQASRRASALGFQLVRGSSFAANPSGRTNRQDYEFMRDEILAQLSDALPLDGVLLGLHGAMVAHGYEDVEADILSRVREMTGPNCVIGVLFDLHCHLTRARVELADVIVLYKEYPHTDVVERADEVIALVLGTIRGALRPVMSLYDCRQIGSYPTTDPLMRGFVDDIKRIEQEAGVLSVSVTHGFAYGDVPEAGGRVLVVTNGDKHLADATAIRVGEAFQDLRGRTTPYFHGVVDGIAAALATRGSPVIVTDAADNAGGGAASDNTTILRHLIMQGVGATALGPIWDPVAVRLCFAAGAGARLALRFGGKTGTSSGTPIDAEVEVIGLMRDAWQSFGPARDRMGDSAAIRVGDIAVVLTAGRTQALGLEMFSHLGINVMANKLLVLKSSNHFMAAYGPIAAAVLHVHSDGLLRRDDYRQIAYARIDRPIWPLDDTPLPGLIL